MRSECNIGLHLVKLFLQNLQIENQTLLVQPGY